MWEIDFLKTYGYEESKEMINYVCYVKDSCNAIDVIMNES